MKHFKMPVDDPSVEDYESSQRKPKVYAFDPPKHASKNDSIEEKGAAAFHTAMGDHAPDSHTGRIGVGTYYKALGMRSSDVDRRTRAQNLTGKDYLEVRAAYGKK